jgi:Carboxypeptidase regulatory-like domain
MSGSECKRDSAQRSSMATMQKRFSVGLIAAALLLCPLIAGASDLASISGRVRDSGGLPVFGAVVVIASASPLFPERIALTDRDGVFSVINLFAGQYSVKVSMPHFLPAMKQGLLLNAGGTAVLTVNLQNALDIVRRAVAREKSDSEDIVWTLRSSRSTQPVLRLADSGQKADQNRPALGPYYSGYFQLYSKSVETSLGATTEGVGSEFSVTMPLDPKSKVNVHGEYNDSPTLPRGIGASYDFVPAAHHKAEVGVAIRQGSLLADPLQSDSSREIQVRYGEAFQWSDHLVLNYGAEAGRAGTVASTTYLRPRFGISWVPQSRTTLTVGTSSQAPLAPDDPIRGRDYFDRTFAVPPGQERYSHSEAGLTHILGENIELTAAAFRDKADTEALFVSNDGRHAILLLDTSNMPSQGLRLSANRRFQAFEAGVSYTGVNGVGIDDRTANAEDMKEQLIRRKFHTVAVRFKADFTATQTEITSVYRWNSGFSASQLDPYQRLMEYNDPTLSVSIAQNLPSFRMIPGRFQAILDARNVLDQSFGTPHAQIGQYPRLVKGGINIRF